MAKRQKTKVFSIKGFDAAHYKATDAYSRAVDNLFDRATNDVASGVAKLNVDENKPFQFSDYPSAQATMKRVANKLAKNITAVISDGSRKQWLFACKKNDEFVASIVDTSKLSKAQVKKMQDRNLDSLQTFQQRKVDGMNLSQRVWKYTEQFKRQIELGIDVGLGEGRSAQQLSRDLRQNLKDPNRLFRRVRDKRGNLHLSKNAKAFHPGIGVYRSSAKNAARLARSEINMAYRESDWLRWQQMDFVIGFEVHRSNHEPLCKCELCAKLVGRYPKWFKFKGWHPQCMCYCTPIMEDYYSKSRDDDRVNRLKAALRGEEYKKYTSPETISDVPDNFKNWVSENMDKQGGWGSTPYFIKDNFIDGKLSGGLRTPIKPMQNETPVKPITPKIDPIQEELNKLQPAIAAVKKLAAEFGIETDIIDNAINGRKAKDVVNAIFEIRNRANNAMNEFKLFVTDSTETINQAKRNSVDSSKLESVLVRIQADKSGWIIGKTTFKQILSKLKQAILNVSTRNKPDESLFMKTATPEQKHIISLKTIGEVETYMVDNGFASKVELSTMPLEHAKMVCATAARYVQEWNLKPFRLSMSRMGNRVFAHANGDYMEMNPTFFNKKNASTKIKQEYADCAGNWREQKKNDINTYKDWADEYKSKIAYFKAKGETYMVNAYANRLKKLEKIIKNAETYINAGYTRHNVFFSEETLVRNLVQHEFGHTIDDQTLGSFNGTRFQYRPLSNVQCNEIVTEINSLFAKYKNNAGWLSTYGITKRGEFVAECMVIYMERGGVGLPNDVKETFDKWKKFANGKI